MASLGFKQYVNVPTRVTKDNRTMIDLLFANHKVRVQVMHEPKITDHAWIKVVLNKKEVQKKYKEFSARNYSNFNVEEFIRLIGNKIERDNEDLEINIRAKRFVNITVDALDITASKKKFRIPKVWEGKKWYSDAIRETANKRDVAYRRTLSDDTEQNWTQFRYERNIVVRLIKEKKKEYYESMIDCNIGDPAKMWQTLKELIRGEQIGSKDIDNIDFDVDNINGGRLAERFNMYYIKSISNIVKSIRVGEYGEGRIRASYVIENERTIENFEMIKVEDLEEIVMGLSKKKDTGEGITSKILKIAFCVVKEELVGIINESLKKGCCPDSWKTSTIIPIPKIKKPKKAGKYRPINVLPIFEKVSSKEANYSIFRV